MGILHLRHCVVVYQIQFLEILRFRHGGQHIPAGLPCPPPPQKKKKKKVGAVTDTEITFKCYISEKWKWWKFLNIQHFLLVHNNQSLQMPWMTGGGNLSQLVYLTPHPRLWSSDCVQIMKMTFKCYISENDENSLKFRHFLHVYSNQSLEMPWMTGGGQPIPAGLSYPPPMIVRAVTGYWFCYCC